MSFDEALTLGAAGNEISKQITGSSKTSVGRTLMATSSGGFWGGLQPRAS